MVKLGASEGSTRLSASTGRSWTFENLARLGREFSDWLAMIFGSAFSGVSVLDTLKLRRPSTFGWFTGEEVVSSPI